MPKVFLTSRTQKCSFYTVTAISKMFGSTVTAIMGASERNGGNKVQDQSTIPSKVDVVIILQTKYRLLIVRNIRNKIHKLREGESVFAEVREWQSDSTIKVRETKVSAPKNG